MTGEKWSRRRFMGDVARSSFSLAMGTRKETIVLPPSIERFDGSKRQQETNFNRYQDLLESVIKKPKEGVKFFDSLLKACNDMGISLRNLDLPPHKLILLTSDQVQEVPNVDGRIFTPERVKNYHPALTVLTPGDYRVLFPVDNVNNLRLLNTDERCARLTEALVRFLLHHEQGHLILKINGVRSELHHQLLKKPSESLLNAVSSRIQGDSLMGRLNDKDKQPLLSAVNNFRNQ